jgi:hypothetical protein
LRASGRRRFPLQTGSCSLVLRRLAPALPEEILRVLAPGGTLIHFTYGARHWQEVYDVLPELPRPRQQDMIPADVERALRAQGFTEATVHIFEEQERVDVEDVALTLQANPAAFFFTPDRDLPRLHDLCRVQGTEGSILLTVHYALSVARAPGDARVSTIDPEPEDVRSVAES